MRTRYNKISFETEGWEREEHFHYFRSFAQPFFNVHTEIDITKLYHYAKWERLPISLAYLHAATASMRATENFLLRLEGSRVVRYQAVDMSITVLKENKTVSFVHLPHHNDLHSFCRESSMIIAEVKKSGKLFHGYNGPDLIHATILPWFGFYGLEHAHQDAPGDAIPKLAFGRLEWKNRQAILPVSVRVHHALADAYHIHRFLEMMNTYIHAVGCSGKVRTGQKSAKESSLKASVWHCFERVATFVLPESARASKHVNAVTLSGKVLSREKLSTHP